ncbi:MAG TPA: bifunctional 3-(3-hydroxy-phenyl)propionate/3-hydroxycinnamic acid hydroxylase [Ktedonobacteraceae bacterium]|nr:bifunctional 3-(3-hydroxy-phenyl)propionate/3-hydroxycinnamic acid hydroxylase [Ktedonobacteraceae bacterium]
MSEQSQPYFSVIIVGAGPTGLAMGNLLGMLGIDVLILERNADLSDFPKAISIDDEGLRICQAMGLDHAIIENVLLDIDAHYITGKRYFAKVTPASKRNGFPLISTFHQPEFEATLLQGLKRFPCVSIQFQHNVKSFRQETDEVVLSVCDAAGNLKTYLCAYLLACDGAKSAIRRQLGIPMRGSTFAQKWLVIDTIHDTDPTAAAVFYCNPERPSVTIPAPHSSRRWEFMLHPGENEEELLRDESIRSLIRQVGGSRNPQIRRRQIYTFHAAIAETFSKGCVFLLGDAAHLMPPFGGQGMNCGLRDAHNLSWKLQKVIQGKAGTALLETYDQESRARAGDLMRFSMFLGRIIMPKSKTVAFVRDSVFFTLNTIPPVRNYLSQAGIKPQPRYKKGFLFVDGSRASKTLAGVLLPQPEIKTAQGQTTLLDNVLGQDFALLRIGHNSEKAFTSLDVDDWQQLGAQFVSLENEIEGFPANQRDLFILVRPDRYIYGVFKDENAHAFILTLRKHLASIIHTQK